MAATVNTPSRSLEQRMAALGKGNRVRSERAQLKRDLKARRQFAGDVIAAPPEWALTMKVFDLIVATPRRGRVKASAALNHVRASHSKTLGGLTDRQRGELVAFLDGRASVYRGNED